jgi:hypothetical protein
LDDDFLCQANHHGGQGFVSSHEEPRGEFLHLHSFVMLVKLMLTEVPSIIT